MYFNLLTPIVPRMSSKQHYPSEIKRLREQMTHIHSEVLLLFSSLRLIEFREKSLRFSAKFTASSTLNPHQVTLPSKTLLHLFMSNPILPHPNSESPALWALLSLPSVRRNTPLRNNSRKPSIKRLRGIEGLLWK